MSQETARVLLILRGAAALALLAAAPATGQTFAPPNAPLPATAGPTVVEQRSFALGYALSISRLRAYAYLESVQKLSTAANDKAAGSMVETLIEQGEEMRRMESAAFADSADLTRALGGPARVEHWMRKAATRLSKPLSPQVSRGASPEDKLSDHLTAIIDDIADVEKDLPDQVDLENGLAKADGPISTWTINLGGFTAQMSLWDGGEDSQSDMQTAARRLAAGEPPGAPSEADGILHSINPPPDIDLSAGGGNLSALLPSHSTHRSSTALRAAPGALMTLYQAGDEARRLDAAEASPDSPP
ncbi:MAG: hypothetical protein ACLQVD_05995 [Capsulimonadaceae bacterium]